MSHPRFNYHPSAIAQHQKMIGQRFERLVVLSDFGHMNSKHQPAYICACDCGNFTRTTGTNLRSGVTKSCGCYQRDISGQKPHDGGLLPLRKRREYRCYRAMVRRCTEPNDPSYPQYGGKGIFVCSEWLGGYAAFFADMGPAPSNAHTIDRIKNSKGYEPSNCRWADRTQQNRNRRNVLHVEMNGEFLPLFVVAKASGLSRDKIRKLIRHGGLSPQQALEAELQTKKNRHGL